METLFPFLFISAGLIFVGLIALFSWTAAAHRKAQIREVAAALGLTYQEQGDYQNTLSNFDLFNVGKRRRIRNVIHGETARETVGIFDYLYVTGGGKNSNHHSQTVVVIQSPELNLPSFTLCPEHLFNKIASFFGYTDINFESHPEFSRRFLLRGADEEAVRKQFTPALLSYFENRTGVTVEGGGNTLLYFRANKTVKPDKFVELMDEAYKVYGQMKQKG